MMAKPDFMRHPTIGVLLALVAGVPHQTRAVLGKGFLRIRCKTTVNMVEQRL
jgi:hypothetical protein